MPRTGTNIYKRKDGRWEARYVKSIEPDGKKRYGSVYAGSYREVKEKQLQCIQAFPHPRRCGRICVHELMQNWLVSRANTVKKSTYLKYESLIRNHLSRGIGDVRIDLLTGQMIDRFTDEKLHSTPPLSPKTVNDILTILSMALAFAEEEYGIPKPRISHVKEPSRQTRVLSASEQQVLESFLLRDMDLYKFGVLLALYTGLRVGELCALQWDDIRNGTVIVNKTLHRIKSGNRTVVAFSSPKSPSSVRTIPLPSFLTLYAARFKGTGQVLQSDDGKCVEPRLMQLRMKKYALVCGLEDVHFHTLRHTFATRCVEAGFDIKSLSEILGHTDVKTTLNRYVHSSFELKRSNMEKLCLSVSTP